LAQASRTRMTRIAARTGGTGSAKPYQSIAPEAGGRIAARLRTAGRSRAANQPRPARFRARTKSQKAEKGTVRQAEVEGTTVGLANDRQDRQATTHRHPPHQPRRRRRPSRGDNPEENGRRAAFNGHGHGHPSRGALRSPLARRSGMSPGRRVPRRARDSCHSTCS
jgi:hypothetical protein